MGNLASNYTWTQRRKTTVQDLETLETVLDEKMLYYTSRLVNDYYGMRRVRIVDSDKVSYVHDSNS
jgi:hypothetical protein